MRIIFVTLLFAFAANGFTQNLLRNPGFENVPNGQTGQGLMPSDWITIHSTPDTYSNDGSYGLPPNGFGNFPGVVAHSGLRWVAGWSGTNETFGQVLTNRLVGGSLYRMSCFLHNGLRADLQYPGSYRLELRRTGNSSTVTLGTLPSTAPGLGWQFREVQFQAPAEAADFDIIAFVPVPGAGQPTYPGADDLVLELHQSRIAGTVELQDFDGNPSTVEIVIEVLSAGTVVETHTIQLQANSSFAVSTNLTGTFDVAIKGTHWLRQIRTNVSLPTSGSGEFWSLINGDCDGDNEVTLVDFGTVSAAFGKAFGDTGYDESADLDGDQEVTLIDFGIVSARFGLAGD